MKVWYYDALVKDTNIKQDNYDGIVQYSAR